MKSYIDIQYCLIQITLGRGGPGVFKSKVDTKCVGEDTVGWDFKKYFPYSTLHGSWVIRTIRSASSTLFERIKGGHQSCPWGHSLKGFLRFFLDLDSASKPSNPRHEPIIGARQVHHPSKSKGETKRVREDKVWTDFRNYCRSTALPESRVILSMMT